jgi:hypothetical protein
MRRKTYCMCIAVILTAIFLSIPSAQNAYALCAAQPEDGNWVNSDPNTRSLTRAALRFTCQDQILNGQLYPPGPPWHIHLWGACSPADCNWGEVGAENVTVGDRTYIHAVYDHGFATRYVYVDMSLERRCRATGSDIRRATDLRQPAAWPG